MAQFIPIPPSNFKPETRTGGCLCGAMRFEYNGVPLEQVHVLSCDCNLCTVQGILAYYTKPGCVKLTKGSWDTLRSYTYYHDYYEHDIVYHFCETCGSFVGSEYPDFTMINARLFDDVDVSRLTLRMFKAKGRTARMDAEEAKAKETAAGSGTVRG